MDTEAMVETRLMSVRSFAEKHTAFSETSLRNWLRKDRNPELFACGAALRMGSKVLIDEARFVDYLRRTNGVEAVDPYDGLNLEH